MLTHIVQCVNHSLDETKMSHHRKPFDTDLSVHMLITVTFHELTQNRKVTYAPGTWCTLTYSINI